MIFLVKLALLALSSESFKFSDLTTTSLCLTKKTNITVFSHAHGVDRNDTLLNQFPLCTHPTSKHLRNVVCGPDDCALLPNNDWTSEQWFTTNPYSTFYNFSKELPSGNFTQGYLCFPKTQPTCYAASGKPCYEGEYYQKYYSHNSNQKFTGVGQGERDVYNMHYHQHNTLENIRNNFDVVQSTSGPTVWWENNYVKPMCPTAVKSVSFEFFPTCTDASYMPTPDTCTEDWYKTGSNEESTFWATFVEDVFPATNSWQAILDVLGLTRSNQTMDLKWGINYEAVDMSKCSSTHFLGHYAVPALFSTLMRTYPPQASTCSTQCKTAACDGDVHYRTYSQRTISGLNGYDASSDCFCYWGDFWSSYWKKNDTGFVVPSRKLSIDNGAHYDTIVQVEFAYDVELDDYYALNADLPTVVCKIIILRKTLSISCNEDCNFVIDHLVFQSTGKTTERIASIDLPDQVFLLTEVLRVRFYNGDVFSSQEELQIIGKTQCEIDDCTFCASAIKNFDCLPTSTKWMLGFLLAMACSAALMAAGWASLLLFVCGKFLFRFLYYTFGCCQSIASCCTSGYRVMGKQVSEGLAKTRQRNTSIQILTEAPEDRAGELKFFILPLLCLVLLPTYVKADNCVGGISIQAMSATCVKGKTSETCSYDTQMLLSLPFSGTSACITLMNSLNESVVGSLWINYEVMKIQVNFAETYYSSNWEGHVETGTSCWTPWNWCGDRCNQILATDVDGFGNLGDYTVKTSPGRTSCARTCGCAGCGCFYCDAACTVSRWAALPIAPFYSISKPTDVVYQVWISVNYTDANGQVRKAPFIAVPGVSTTTLPDLKLEFIGALQVNAAPYLTKFLRIDDSGQASLTEASPINSPQVGLPGDIQGDSVAYLQNPLSRISARVSPNLYQGNSFATSGASYDRIHLPGTYLGSIWSVSGFSVLTNATQTPPLLLKLQTSGSFKMTRTISSVCPVISLNEAKGCFACPLGFYINITAYSTCLGGNVAVWSEDFSVKTGAIQIGQDAATFQIWAASALKQVSGILYVGSETKTASIPVVVTLQESSVFQADTNYTTGDVIIKGPSSSMDGLSFFLSDVAFGNLANSVWSVLSIIGAMIMIFVLIKWIMSLDCKRRSKKD